MEGDNTFSMAQHIHQLDKGMQNVMPESWEGHSRLALETFADGLTEEQYRFAQRLATRMHGKARPEAVARVSSKKAAEKVE